MYTQEIDAQSNAIHIVDKKRYQPGNQNSNSQSPPQELGMALTIASPHSWKKVIPMLLFIFF